MTKNSRADRRRTRGAGVSGITVDQKQKFDKLPEGRFGMIVPPFPEKIRDAIQACTCPWCGRGPWKMLAAHVSKMHGVAPDQLREMAGLIKSASICDPAFSTERRELAKGRNATPPRSHKGMRKVISAPGLEGLRRAGAAVPFEVRSEWGRRSKGKNVGPRKPRNQCVVCGVNVPYSPGNARQKTCGKECLSVVKSSNMASMRASQPATARRTADCHPDRPHCALGLCKSCWRAQHRTTSQQRMT